MIGTDLPGVGRRVFLCALVLALAGPAVQAAPDRPRAAPAKVTGEDRGRVVFRVDVPEARLSAGSVIPGTVRLDLDGYERLGPPGSPPVLSRCFLVGLPPTGAYSISYRVLGTRSLGLHRLEPIGKPVGIHDDEMGPLLSERIEWDEAAFRAYRDPPMAEAQEAAFVRHQRILPVRVNPVSYNPASQQLAIATTIEVEVRFAPPAERGMARPPAGKGWNDVFGRLLVNAGQSKPWRDALEPVISAPAPALRVAPGAVKIRVRDTGMHSAIASVLIASGFPAGQSTAAIRLFRRSYDETTLAPGEQEVACEVTEDPGGAPGVFDGNDRLIFYGRRLRDDPTQGDTREQFSAYNVYWLEPTAGTRMNERTPGVGFVTADTAAASFPRTDHFETDVWFRDGTPSGINDVYYYNLGFEPGPIDMPFTMDAAQPGTNVTLSAELHGQSYDNRAIKLSLVNSQGEQVLNASYGILGKARLTFSAPVPAAGLDPGANTFRMSRPTSPSRTSVQVLLNFVEASYRALYRARGNTLRFNSATLAGDTSITVTGITSTDGIELYDVTDPLVPVHVRLTPAHLQPADGGTALSFRESFSGRREYTLLRDAGIIPVASADIVADRPGSIIGGAAENGVDVLVVAYRDFIPAMRQWVSYRRAQGYRVYMADVDDVFDEFNGGVPSARAVYRFARHFFERGDAGTLVLVGDSSEDHKHVHADSGPDFVPTFTRNDNVSSLGEDEVVTTDKRFVKFPGPGGTIDVFPDMVVGRIPVGEVGELEAVLNKTLAYEAPGPSDFWRKRMIMVADDQYSEGGSTFGGFQFCKSPGEQQFETSQENVAQTIENSLPAGYDVVRFFMRTLTAPFYTTQCANKFAAITYTRTNVTEPLMNELDQGATLVTIQSHMNRSVVTHERVLVTQPASILGGSTGRDHLRLENRFKPWIIFAMGCHFSEYAIHREMEASRVNDNNPNGDSFAEQLLFQNERGAVNTYGSSGFEYLGPNAAYLETMARVWFYEAPYDTMLNQTQAEWKFGELMFLVEAQMASFQPDPVERYHILGDPLLRIDAGPPAFQVTVDGRPAQTGDIVSSGGEGDTIQVVAVVTDENAIHKFSLEVAGADLTDSLTVVPLVDPTLPHARQYRVSFRHKVRPETYDIVLRAFQSPDTLAGSYHMAAEFRLKVESSITVAVNGRTIESGAAVPSDGSYRIDIVFPVFIPAASIAVSLDQAVVADAALTHPSPEDSLAWIITFRRKLDAGTHHLKVVAGAIEFNYTLLVSNDTGLSNVINYPNPFGGAGTRFMYTNEVEIVDGSIDIFTVSGKRIRRLDIPVGARLPGQNSVFWDGRDGAGEAVANGTYLYVVNVRQRGGSATLRGALSKIE